MADDLGDFNWDTGGGGFDMGGSSTFTGSEYDWWRPYGTSDEMWWNMNTPADIDPYDTRFYRDSIGLGNTPGTPDVSFIPVSDSAKGLTIKDVVDFLKSPAGKAISAAGMTAISKWLGGSSGADEKVGYQGGVPLYQATRQQYAVPLSTQGRPEDTNAEAIRYWLNQPGLTEGQVAQEMFRFGVTPERMAEVRGTDPAAESAKYRAAFGPNLMVTRRPGAGGITYFGPTTYIDNGVTPSTASGFNRNWYGTPVAPLPPTTPVSPTAPIPPEEAPGPGAGGGTPNASGGLISALASRAKHSGGTTARFASGGAVDFDTLVTPDYLMNYGATPAELQWGQNTKQKYAGVLGSFGDTNPFMGLTWEQLNDPRLVTALKIGDSKLGGMGGLNEPEFGKKERINRLYQQAFNTAWENRLAPTTVPPPNHYDMARPNAAVNGPGVGAAANTQGVTWAPGVGYFDPATQRANLAAAPAAISGGIASLAAAPAVAPAATPATPAAPATPVTPATPAAASAAPARRAGYYRHAFPSRRRLAAGGLAALPQGRLVQGPGDGTSDSVSALVDGKEPAKLGSGEFVFPARAVAEVGNGSTEAGARKLYALLDKIEAKAKQAKRGKPSGADKLLNKLA